MTNALVTRLRNRLARFARDTRGDVSLEAIIWFPLLYGIIAMSLVTYDGIRRDSLGEKAAFVLADMVSRETETVNNTYIRSARKVAALIARADYADVTVRVSEIAQDEAGVVSVNWTRVDGNTVNALTTADLPGMLVEVPQLSSNERVVLVETFVTYDGPVNPGPLGLIGFDALLGLDNQVYVGKAVARPRFAPQVAYADIWE